MKHPLLMAIAPMPSLPLAPWNLVYLPLLTAGMLCLGMGAGEVAALEPANMCGEMVKSLSYKHPLLLSAQTSAALAVNPNRQRMSNKESRCPPGMYTPEGKVALTLTPQDGTSYTLAERPVFYVYFPFQSISELTFRLYSPEQKLVYQAPISLGAQRGILALQLPENAPPLQPNQDYEWTLQWFGEDAITLAGTIRRITPTGQTSRQLTQGSERTKPEVYAQSGLWQDALTSLAQLRLRQPSNPTIQADWRALLSEVKLADLANEPVVPIVLKSSSRPHP